MDLKSRLKQSNTNNLVTPKVFTIFFTSDDVTVGGVTAFVTPEVRDHRLSVDDRRDAAARRAADVAHFIVVTHHADVIVDAGSVTDVAASRDRHRAVQRIVTREWTRRLWQKN